MTKKEIFDYIKHTPFNTNLNILDNMLDELTDTSGGGKPDGSGIVSTVMLGTDFYIYSQISGIFSSLEVEENA